MYKVRGLEGFNFGCLGFLIARRDTVCKGWMILHYN